MDETLSDQWRDVPVSWPACSNVSLSIRAYGDVFAEISGNKSFKLKYFIEAAPANAPLLSFGGAWSNHLLALAAKANELGRSSIGIIRGEAPAYPSPCLLKMKELGMHLHFISRSDYRNKAQADFIAHLIDLFPGAYIIPEGGAGTSGIRGAQEMVNSQEHYDYVVLPAATGTTVAGVAEKLKNSPIKIIGIQVLKGQEAIRTQLLETARVDVLHYANLSIFEEFHHGGYAKTTEQLEQFADMWNQSPNLPLDRIYGIKAMFAIVQLIERHYLSVGSRILYLHTGGLACTGKPTERNEKVIRK